ncbi:hypothetical protein ABKN59_010870 [Abortiporus biennis]
MKDLHLAIPVAQPLSFARPLTPGCPTDSEVSSHASGPWSLSMPSTPQPHTATYLCLQSSAEPTVVNTLDPNVITQWRTKPGSYIAFSLDTELIATQFPPGSPGHHAIIEFNTGIFVGLVITSITHKMCTDHGDASTGEILEELTVHYVADSPPGIIGNENNWMSISPTSSITGFSSDGARKPLQTQPLFPWHDRYQWTTFGTRLSVTQFTESKLSFTLDDDEFGRIEDKICADYPVMNQADAALESSGDLRMRARADRLKVPLCSALPAKVWRDVRMANEKDDPTRFMKEVEQLEQ